MSGTTISGSSTTGVFLATPADNPVLVTGTISVASGIALNGQGGVVWTVTNAGLIDGNAIGVLLSSGGVTNQSNGTILGSGSAAYGVEATSVTNNGLISATGYGVLNASAVYNGTNATIAGAKGGVKLSFGSLVNAGTIEATGGYATGVVLQSGAVATNAAGGTIGATGLGINLSSGTGTVVNYGRIDAGYYGVARATSVTNQAGGTITGGKAGLNLAVSVVNAGSILATGADSTGIVLQAGGVISNVSGGSIAGTGYGIKASAGAATVETAGYIGGTQDAIEFANYASSLLVIDPGAVFAGTVYGGNSSTSVLELAGGGAGVIAGLGSQYVDFTQITVDAGSNWSLNGGNTIGSGVVLSGSAPLMLAAAATLVLAGTIAGGQTIAFAGAGAALTVSSGGTIAGAITGFAPGETIDLQGVDPASVSFASGMLSYAGPGGMTSFALSADGGSVYAVSDGADGADVEVACFAAGTRIASPGGDRAVEHLRAGDLVLTRSGAARPVRWIGCRRLDLGRHAAPETAQPIRVRAGAIAGGTPCRDLLLSPDHAILLDGVLIPVRLLVNRASIVPETGCWSVTYYHVELDSHDILLAENLAVESYLDTGNRRMFQNAPGPLLLHPDLTNDQHRREAGSCAPFAADPARVAPVWQRLAARAVHLGCALPPPPATTDDPDLHVVAAGRRIRPLGRDGRRYLFMLPRGAATLRLVSRSAIANAFQPWLDDRRRLGVQVARLTLRSCEAMQAVPVDHPALGDGWWAAEQDAACLCRWTNGEAVVSLDHGEAAVLEIELAGGMTYMLETDTVSVPARLAA
jgi:hypothetical protein